MALGFCPAMLMHMKYVIGENAPENKVTPSGFLRANLERGAQAKLIGDPFSLADDFGHIKDLRLKYYTRTTPAQMATEDNCDTDLVPAYDEITIDSVDTVKFGIHLSDDTVARYCKEATDTVAMGKAPSAFMRETLAVVLASMNGFVGKIDQTLLSSIVWGFNQVTGNNTAVSVNFNNDSTTNSFAEGWTKIMSDYAANEGQGRPIIFGSGNINSAALQAMNPAMTQYAQLNNNAAMGNFDYYFDLHAASILGANQFGVLMPGTFGLVQLDEYKGFREYINTMKGDSYFFNMPVPVNLPGTDGMLGMLNIDFQLRAINCQQDATVGYETVTLGRGWNLTMKKNFALWQVPSDAYQAADRLFQNNGALRYTATNT